MQVLKGGSQSNISIHYNENHLSFTAVCLQGVCHADLFHCEPPFFHCCLFTGCLSRRPVSLWTTFLSLLSVYRVFVTQTCFTVNHLSFTAVCLQGVCHTDLFHCEPPFFHCCLFTGCLSHRPVSLWTTFLSLLSVYRVFVTQTCFTVHCFFLVQHSMVVLR